jgi:dipeptidyl aminopeptidase/acylaminoacyl peptidase
LRNSISMAALLAMTPLQAHAAHPVMIDDLLAQVQLRGLTCTTDGRSAAWVAGTVDAKADKRRNRIWIADLTGGARPLTAADEDAGNPAFSPDGRYVSFTAKRGKDEQDQIWRLDRQGGEAERLTDVEGDIDSYRWSPDGTRIVIAMNDPDPKPPADDPKRPLPLVIDAVHFKQDNAGFLTAGSHSHLWLFDVASRKLTRLTPSGPWDESAMQWSPDGHSIAFIADHESDAASPARQWLEVIPAEPGAAARVVAKLPTTPGQALVWSPDGRRIVHAVGFAETRLFEYAQPQLAETDLASGTTRILPATAGLAIGNPVALGKGRVGGILEDDRHAIAVAIDPTGGPLQRLGDPSLAVAAQCEAGDGGKAPRAVIAGSDTEPAEVRVLGGATLSAHNTATGVAWAMPEDFSARASDGNEVHGMLYRPAGYQPGHRYPTVLWIHGGPVAQDQHGQGPALGDGHMRQLLAAHGYAVLAVNYRGSSGRGLDYSATIAGDWGDKEVKDLDAALDWAVASGVADPDRLAVGG